MLFRASVDSLVEFFSRWIHSQDANSRGEWRRLNPQRSLLRDRLARLQTEFDYAMHKRTISGVPLLIFPLMQRMVILSKVLLSPVLLFFFLPFLQLLPLLGTRYEKTVK